MSDRTEALRRWSEGVRNAAAENVTVLAPGEDLDPVLLMGIEDDKGEPADFIMAPLLGLIGGPDWEDFKARTMPALIAERRAKIVSVVTMAWQRPVAYDGKDKVEVVVIVSGAKGVGVEVQTAEVTRNGDAPPTLGEWSTTAEAGGSVASAVALGLEAQDGLSAEGL